MCDILEYVLTAIMSPYIWLKNVFAEVEVWLQLGSISSHNTMNVSKGQIPTELELGSFCLTRHCSQNCKKGEEKREFMAINTYKSHRTFLLPPRKRDIGPVGVVGTERSSWHLVWRRDLERGHREGDADKGSSCAGVYLHRTERLCCASHF